MSAKLKALFDQRAKAWAEVQDIRERLERDGYNPTTEDNETFTRALDEVERLSQLIESEQRAAGLDESMTGGGTDPAPARPQPVDERTDTEVYERAFDAYLRRGMTRLSAEHQAALERGFVTDAELRAQAAGTGADGGYTVPPGFLQRLTETMKQFGGIARYATIIPTATGNPTQWPSNDDTGNEGAILDENTQVGEQSFTFGTNTLSAYMYTSKLVKVSLQLMQDSVFPLDTWLPRRLGIRIGRASAGHFATGTGINQPKGITNGAVGATGATGQTTSITYNDLVDLIYSVDAAYRDTGTCRWIGNDKIFQAARKLVDGNNRPLWEPSTQAGQPDLLLGYPLTTDNKMPAPAASAKSLAFGDFEAGYVIRMVQGATVMRLSERYADFLQVAFLGFQRIDATIDDSAAFRLYQHSAT